MIMKILAGKFNFRAITSGALRNDPIPDQVVYRGYKKGKKLDKDKRLYDKIVYSSKKTKETDLIVVILESPHTEEFKQPKGPLKNSWDDFCDYFDDELRKSRFSKLLFDCKSYNIAFVNFCNYQCSEGKNLKANQSIKNSNLRKCWKAGFKDDLRDRIVYLNPTLIINLCTWPFKGRINNMFKNRNNFTFGDHPSSWKRIKGNPSNANKNLIK